MSASDAFTQLSDSVAHLDFPTHQKHGSRGTDSGGVERLQMVDDIPDCIYALKGGRTERSW